MRQAGSAGGFSKATLDSLGFCFERINISLLSGFISHECWISVCLTILPRYSSQQGAQTKECLLTWPVEAPERCMGRDSLCWLQFNPFGCPPRRPHTVRASAACAGWAPALPWASASVSKPDHEPVISQSLSLHAPSAQRDDCLTTSSLHSTRVTNRPEPTFLPHYPSSQPRGHFEIKRMGPIIVAAKAEGW